jgi:hypothetical protein
MYLKLNNDYYTAPTVVDIGQQLDYPATSARDDISKLFVQAISTGVAVLSYQVLFKMLANKTSVYSMGWHIANAQYKAINVYLNQVNSQIALFRISSPNGQWFLNNQLIKFNNLADVRTMLVTGVEIGEVYPILHQLVALTVNPHDWSLSGVFQDVSGDRVKISLADDLLHGHLQVFGNGKFPNPVNVMIDHGVADTDVKALQKILKTPEYSNDLFKKEINIAKQLPDIETRAIMTDSRAIFARGVGVVGSFVTFIAVQEAINFMIKYFEKSAQGVAATGVNHLYWSVPSAAEAKSWNDTHDRNHQIEANTLQKVVHHSPNEHWDMFSFASDSGNDQQRAIFIKTLSSSQPLYRPNGIDDDIYLGKLSNANLHDAVITLDISSNTAEENKNLFDDVYACVLLNT